MTGSEKTGYEHSDILLLENAYYILTPTPQTNNSTLEEYISLVKTMGAIPIVLDPVEHDKITAAISHATVTSAHDLKASAIITVTKGGGTARMISRYRPDCPIISCTTNGGETITPTITEDKGKPYTIISTGVPNAGLQVTAQVVL